MPVKHRCGFCLRVVRADGTCQNEVCPRYAPDKPKEEEPTPQETPSEVTTTPSTGGNA